MSMADDGNTVKFHYACKLGDGTEFDSSAGRAPVEVTIGAGRAIKGIEQALIGMAAGESKIVTLSAEDAYGVHRPELVQQVERARIPSEVTLEVGGMIQATSPEGQPVNLKVIGLDEQMVTLDANHPLAGKDITFELSVLEVA